MVGGLFYPYPSYEEPVNMAISRRCIRPTSHIILRMWLNEYFCSEKTGASRYVEPQSLCAHLLGIENEPISKREMLG